MPQRYLASANLMPKKKEGREAPPSGHPISRFPACQSALPESIGALRGRTPIHGKFYRGHARYACRRTPRQTSGLPAGAEPSLESKDIIASTNPECSDTFEYNRTTQLHRYTATELQSCIATHGEEYDYHFAVHTFGKITPRAPALNPVRSAEVETSQFVQSSIKERQLEKARRAFVIFEKSSSPNSTLSRARHSLNIMPMEVGDPFHPAKLTVLRERHAVHIDSMLARRSTFIPERSRTVKESQHQKVCCQFTQSDMLNLLISTVLKIENSWNQKLISCGLMP